MFKVIYYEVFFIPAVKIWLVLLRGLGLVLLGTIC